ncbi:hypothetical protein NF867_15490 [Solitalea sp. MAHUQ-68]|uniref:Lipoprotein n=1 Tax=Solitalea agri TaxID=2953739 RepID=A0A9X2JE19_9SPHI|nr:hypothetical protein [Solitalea agri]MCO4294264.1 hypothetical protein [Solitalea agri]
MKPVVLLFSALLLITSCKKDDSAKKVRFLVTGTSVTDVKFNFKSTVQAFKVPFTGTKDTTVMVSESSPLSLNAKSTGGRLTGQIYVDGVLVSEKIDNDTDGDGKTEVKADYELK